MPPDSPLLEQCFSRVLHEAPSMLGRVIEEIIATLQEAEKKGQDVRERERLARAWWNLTQQATSLAQMFPRRLDQAFREAGTDSQHSTLTPTSDSSLLSLVDDSALDESLESARLIQALMPVVEQSLSMVDARMSSLIGLDTVHAEKNPLRPSIFVRALRDVLAEREPDAEIRSQWMQRAGGPLGRNLCHLYEQVALMLQQANVQEAGYRVRLVADFQASQNGAVSTRGWLEGDEDAPREKRSQRAPARPDTPPLAMRMSDLAREHSGLQADVMQAFLGGDPSSFDKPLDNAYYEQVRRELARVDTFARMAAPDPARREQEQVQRRGLPVVDRPVQPMDIGAQLDPQQWGDYAAPQERSRVLLELKHQADQVAQAVGLDVVRKLVSQVAGDPLLLTPVRESVVALEPALLRLAMSEPRYFSREDHPARQLIEQTAQRSFRYNDEYSSEFEEFIAPVRQQVQALNASGAVDAAPFASALDSLQTAWSAADEAEDIRKRSQLEAVRFAQTRQERADQIAWEISNRPDVFNAPGVVLDFLYGSWSLVIASDELKHPDAGPDPSGYRKVISQLLWSTRREVTLRQPRQLFEVVPRMVLTLRKGLEELGKTPEETQTFFDALLKLHEPVLKLRRMRALADGSSSGPTPLEEVQEDEETAALLAPATAQQQRPRAPEQPWLGAGERRSAGFDDTLVLDDGGSVEAREAQEDRGLEKVEKEEEAVRPAASVAGQRTAFADPLTMLAALHIGDWVDLYSAGQWLRAELVWSSSKASLFMFTSRGGRTHTMTRRSCERLLLKRWLRPVATHTVVSRALEKVARVDGQVQTV
ncbi:MAG: DUF1631 family protein [Burkholderiaceae bacterium]